MFAIPSLQIGDREEEHTRRVMGLMDWRVGFVAFFGTVLYSTTKCTHSKDTLILLAILVAVRTLQYGLAAFLFTLPLPDREGSAGILPIGQLNDLLQIELACQFAFKLTIRCEPLPFTNIYNAGCECWLVVYNLLLAFEVFEAVTGHTFIGWRKRKEQILGRIHFGQRFGCSHVDLAKRR